MTFSESDVQEFLAFKAFMKVKNDDPQQGKTKVLAAAQAGTCASHIRSLLKRANKAMTLSQIAKALKRKHYKYPAVASAIQCLMKREHIVREGRGVYAIA